MNSADDIPGDKLDEQTLKRVAEMLSNLPRRQQEFLVELLTGSYEFLQHMGAEQIDDVRRRVQRRPGETVAETVLNQLCVLVIRSPRSTDFERQYARRLRAQQSLADLLRGDEGEPPLRTEEMARLLGQTPTVINRRARQGRYVCAKLQGINRYPVWQFAKNGRVASTEIAALYAFFGESRRWQWIDFLHTRQPDLDEARPIDWLNAGKGFAAVERLAKKETGVIEAL